jgi:hypothetical protein
MRVFGAPRGATSTARQGVCTSGWASSESKRANASEGPLADGSAGATFGPVSDEVPEVDWRGAGSDEGDGGGSRLAANPSGALRARLLVASYLLCERRENERLEIVRRGPELVEMSPLE